MALGCRTEKEQSKKKIDVRKNGITRRTKKGPIKKTGTQNEELVLGAVVLI